MSVRVMKLAGWLVIAGGMLVSAFRVVMALGTQAFDQVAPAGLPALICLAVGVLVLTLAHVIEDIGAAGAATGRFLGALCPTQPASLIGLVLLVGGVGWIVYVYTSLNEPSVRAWAIIPASFGGLAALVGLVLMLVAGMRGERRR